MDSDWEGPTGRVISLSMSSHLISFRSLSPGEAMMAFRLEGDELERTLVLDFVDGCGRTVFDFDTLFCLSGSGIMVEPCISDGPLAWRGYLVLRG